MSDIIQQLKFDENGLLVAIAQDFQNNDILMVAYMNREALEKTLKGPNVTFWSRSRKKLWTKGEESGHTLEVKEIFYDCDGDALIIKVKNNGPVCHEGYRSCFFRKIENGESKIIAERMKDPKEIYKK